MKECSKAIARRQRDPAFMSRFFKGSGIDIGGAPDPLALYSSLFPLIASVRTWDLDDGDAQYMDGVPDESFDFVHSSHCLEHIREPALGLRNWFRILRPGGFLVITVPDEDLYEQGTFPSTFNRDHKWTFTINKESSWSERSLNVFDLVSSIGSAAAVHKIELIDHAYRYNLPRFDQTLTPVAESAIEFVVRRRESRELEFRGQPARTTQPEASLRAHFNQYRDDIKTLKQANTYQPPFSNKDEL
jgi:SAM-dependent methyltransferase